MKCILIGGDVGTGKTMSLFPFEEFGIVGIPPEQSLYTTTAGHGKHPLIPGWKKKFKSDLDIKNGGHIYRSYDPNKINKAWKWIANNRPEIKYFILDDSDYAMGFNVLSNEDKLEFDDWRKLGVDFFNKLVLPIVTGEGFSDDTTLIYLFHTDTDAQGNIKLKTAGNMIDKYVKLEGIVSNLLFTTTVLNVATGQQEHKFLIRKKGSVPAKVLPGLYPKDVEYIPNDIGLFLQRWIEHEEG